MPRTREITRKDVINETRDITPYASEIILHSQFLLYQ